MLIDWHRAKRLALGKSTWCTFFVNLVSLRTGDPELLHPKLQRWTLHSKLRSRSVRASEDPVALLEDRQYVLSFDLRQSRSSICLTIWVRRF